MTLLLLDTTFIIAATARASKRRVVTRDLTAFTDLPGVTVLDRQ